jgi:hypothetical protein
MHPSHSEAEVTYLLNYGVTSVVDFQEITASDEEYI